MIGNECYFFDLRKGNCKSCLSVFFFSFLFLTLIACLVFPPRFLPAILCSVIYGVQQATIWTVNVVSVTAKLLYTLLVLCFLNHERHYHYRWCSILFWSLDSGLCMIKNKIYGTVQSAASVFACRTSSSACIVIALIKPYKYIFPTLCLRSKIAVTWQFYYPVGEDPFEYLMFVMSIVFAAP